MKIQISGLLLLMGSLFLPHSVWPESLPLSVPVDKASVLKGGYAQHAIQSGSPSNNRQDEMRYVDIAFFYAPNLLDELNQEEIQAYIEEQTGFANLALDNNGIENLRRRVVYVGRLDIDNENTPELQNLYNFFGENEEGIQTSTFQFFADYKILVRKNLDPNFCGRGGLGNPRATIEYGSSCNYSSLAAHEWGHNDGMAHDLSSASVHPQETYAYGHHCDGNGTIMNESLNLINRHPFYSSPDILVSGQSCGIEDEADNARLLRVQMEKALSGEIALDGANNFGTMQIHGSVAFSTLPELDVFPSQGPVRFTLKREGDLNPVDVFDNPQPISVELYTKAISAIPGQDYEITIQRVELAPGQEFAEVEIPLLNDPRSRNTVQFEVGLRYPLSLEVTSEPVVVSLLSEHPFTGNAAFTSSSQNVTASSTSLTLTVNRTGSTAGELIILWFIDDVNTSEGTDYTPGSGELVFADGEDSKTIELSLPNPNQTTQRQFKVILDSADAIAPNELLVTIAASSPPSDNNSSGGSDSGGGGSLGMFMLFIALLGLRRRQ